jgi:xanthine dehydrogenase accessory factor
MAGYQGSRKVEMEQIWEESIKRFDAGERVAFCVVVEARGSTPQGAGAKMLVVADGKTIGTLGGGCVEAEVRRRALELLAAGESRLLEFRLDHDYGWDDGLICGGMMGIYVDLVDAALIAQFTELERALAEKRPAVLRMGYESPQGQREYVEELSPAPVLVIAGAGHVGQALASLAVTMDFRVVVIDDRAEYASRERFPHAEQHIVGEIEAELSRYAINSNTYIVIVTRGHRHDGRALRAVVNSPAKYLGLIGSKAKIKLIFDELAAEGVGPQQLHRVHSPIGLNIGAVTVPEIAVSIAAELIAVRRGCTGQTGPMKLASNELQRWLERERH